MVSHLSANSIAQAIEANKVRKPDYAQNPERRLGTVSLAYSRTDPKLPVTFDGEDIEVLLPTIVEAMPGDRVTIEKYNKQWVVTGAIRDFDWFFAGNLGFGTGWSNYGAPWESVKIRRDPAGNIFMEGMMRSTISPNTNVMFTLPEGYRPTHPRLQVVASNVPKRIIININGTLTMYQDSVAVNDFISFSGVVFMAGV